ncbi:MAG: hypothetical protein H6550_07760 [Chitinophagales bacterium]|nr:hypothetical protein [Chitinophagales bacterium]
MRKNQLFTALLSLICLSAKAQPEKGTTFIGLGVTTEKAYSAINSSFMVPKVGYFINKHWVVGTSLFVGGRVQADAFAYNVGIRPFARYYFAGKNAPADKKLFWFIEANTGVNRLASKEFGGIYEYSYNYINCGLGGGVNYYVTPDVSIEALIRLDANNNVNGQGRFENNFYNVPNSYSIKPVAEIGVNFNIRGRKKSQIE